MHHESVAFLLHGCCCSCNFLGTPLSAVRGSLQEWSEVKLNVKKAFMRVQPHYENFKTLFMLVVLLLDQELITYL